MKKLLFLLTSALGLSAIASPALATYVSDTGKTVITRDWQKESLVYFSQVGNERIAGNVQGRYGATGYFQGTFTDWSSNGDVCQGDFVLTGSSPTGGRTALWTVTSAARGASCGTVGQEFSTVVQTQLSESQYGTGGTLAELDPMERVNVRSGPSLDSNAHSYGMPGDRVWIQRQSGQWYQVRFQKGGATGWIHRSRVISDDYYMNG